MYKDCRETFRNLIADSLYFLLSYTPENLNEGTLVKAMIADSLAIPHSTSLQAPLLARYLAQLVISQRYRRAPIHSQPIECQDKQCKMA